MKNIKISLYEVESFIYLFYIIMSGNWNNEIPLFTLQILYVSLCYLFVTVWHGECSESFIQAFMILNWTTNMACGKFWDCVTVTFARNVQNSYDGVFCEFTGFYSRIKSSNTEIKNHHASRNKITTKGVSIF